MTNLCLYLILEEYGDSSEDGCLGMLSSCLLEALVFSALPSLDNQAPGPRSGRAGLRNQSHKTCCRVRVSSSIASLTPLCGMMNWSKNEFSNILQVISCSSQKKRRKTVKFWILSRLPSFKEPIFLKHILALFVQMLQPEN